MDPTDRKEIMTTETTLDANTVLTRIIEAYGEEYSAYEDHYDRLNDLDLGQVHSLTCDAVSLTTTGSKDNVSERLWTDAVDALSTLRIQAGLELAECEALLDVINDCLNVQMLDDILGGKSSVRATLDRTKKRIRVTKKRMAVLIKLEKQLYKLAGKKVHPILKQGVCAYN
jgi:hypothetical protein